MEISVTQLLTIIGELTVREWLLKQEVASLILNDEEEGEE